MQNGRSLSPSNCGDRVIFGSSRNRSRGLTLVELMVSIALGMLVLTALVAMYGSVTRTNNEMSKTNQLIENGRFAMQILQADVALAGFWGPLDSIEATAVPDPCLSYSTWSVDPAAREIYKTNLLSVPVHVYSNATALATCGGGLAGVLPQSDVLIVRRASTCVAGASCGGGSDNGPHIQVSGCRTDAPPEPAYVVESKLELDARATASPSTKIRLKDCATEAPRRKVVVNLYYLAASAAGVPTLMRVSMVNGNFSTPEPLVDGIEAFKVELGIDNLGSNGLPISSSNPGDGNADAYVTCPAAGCTVAELANAVSAKLHLLARNIEPTVGHADSKSYTVGPLTIAAPGDNFKRHVFTTTARMVNPSSRREIP